ncbi:hypothetical protein HPB51_002079 [Rhipicephalus microplus]|uniref:Uncharacterized protein n=1 Tax=Rhipicephalus microplus TaxID=6941 RepID=A0A9J6E5R9_RHIMP|nr:hypothetical protein HPB51_002079 [Rhipicephalus microplus]
MHPFAAGINFCLLGAIVPSDQLCRLRRSVTVIANVLTGHETELVKDTSDDLWFLEESSSDCMSSDSEATQRRLLRVAALAAELLQREEEGRDSDDCPFEVEYEIEEESDRDGDTKAGSISSDSDIEDLWQCRLCGMECEPHGMSHVQRYCTTCWKERFGWLPDREERHPPQKKRRRVQRRNSHGTRNRRASNATGINGVNSSDRLQLNSAGEESPAGSCGDSANSPSEVCSLVSSVGGYAL